MAFVAYLKPIRREKKKRKKRENREERKRRQAKVDLLLPSSSRHSHTELGKVACLSGSVFLEHRLHLHLLHCYQ